MSSGNGFAIQIGPPDSRGHRQVTASLGNRSHRDKFDPDDNFRRSKFIDKAIGKLDLGEDAHQHQGAEPGRVHASNFASGRNKSAESEIPCAMT